MAVQNKGAYFNIDWKIKNFKEFPSRKGQLLSSPTFSIDTLHNSQWALHLYPDGDNDGNGKCTALYLVRKSDDDYAEDIKLSCKLSLLPPGLKELQMIWGTAPVLWESTYHTFQKGSRCGSQQFLEREKISTYLENNTLTIHCEMFQYDIDSSKSGRCAAVSMIGTERMSFEWIIEDFQDLQVGEKKITPIKSFLKAEYSMTMALSMTSEKKLMVDISPVDGKRIKRAYCSLYAKNAPESVYCGSYGVWFDEIKSENWSFPLVYSKDELLEKQTNSSLLLECLFHFDLGVEFEKIENSFYGPDKKNESCRIM